MFNELKKVIFKDDLIVISEFLDGTVTTYDFKNLFSEYPVFRRLLEDDNLYRNGHICIGGVALIFDDELDIAAEELYFNGKIIEKKEVGINITIATAVTTARLKKGITQKELAKLTKIHQAEISKIERGIGNPSVKTLDRIAKGLGLKLELFLK